MRRLGCIFLAAALGLVAPLSGASPTNAPDLNEVLGVVRAHLPGVTETELNQAAVDGVLQALRGKVGLVGESGGGITNPIQSLAVSLLESNIAYARFTGLPTNAAAQISEVINQWNRTNPLSGVVLDLRFANSEDYEAAADVADLFLSKARPLLDWGQGMKRSREKSDPIRLPVALLVNRETGAAAEALAAVMRETGAGLILGSTTAGRAMVGREFPLKDGRRLRVATVPVRFGESSELTAKGLQPDIKVEVSLSEEQAYAGDPYGVRLRPTVLADSGSATNRSSRRPRGGEGELSGTSTNGSPTLTRRSRPTEADLVRARREGLNLDGDIMEGRPIEVVRPYIQDPTLARAVDLIKGLAVVRASRS